MKSAFFSKEQRRRHGNFLLKAVQIGVFALTSSNLFLEFFSCSTPCSFFVAKATFQPEEILTHWK
jgi:hypothetical protein